MTRRLRPTAPLASDAILVGDPGRALLLAQELLEKPKMSNHARGLWGYSGDAGRGRLTVQATGMGGPSAAIVIDDLARLGVRRVVRVGTCLALDAALELGGLLIVVEAIAAGGSADSFGVAAGGSAEPDAALTVALESALAGEATAARVASFDHIPAPGEASPPGAVAADMQTVAVLARSRELEIDAAAVLIVAGSAAGSALEETEMEAATKLAGQAAAAVLSG